VDARSQVEAGVEALGSDRRLGVDGVHVYARGEVLAERHWLADIRRDVFLVSKTFTSAAVGIAEAEGLLTLDDPILVVCEHEACVTVTAHFQGPTTDLLDQIWALIVPALTVRSEIGA
jgi:hypothetical protein